LIERFDGSAWRIVPSPNPGADTFSVLQAVSGTSATDAWAVGVTHNGTLPSRTLIQRWNGTAWSIVPSPNPGLQLNELRGVVALSPSNAWAVGFREGSSGTGPTLETLILHWDGVQWAQVETPSVGSGANQLFGIGAISANDLWAVGSAGGAPLALRWRGTGWSVVDVARDAGLSQEFLTSVSGASGDDVWAVGQGRGIFSNQVFGTIRHWDGVHWTEKTCYAHSASNPPENYEGGGPTAYFTGVSARSGNDVWAVGVRGSGPMILHWDGTAWTPVVHPRAFPNSASLRGVAALGGGSAWSVGGEILVDPSGAASPERTLIDRYSP
jgi:hypothetical protein